MWDWYGMTAILLVLIGLGLIIAEVFLPSGGLIAIFTACVFVAAITCAAFAWWRYPLIFWAFVGGILLAIPATIVTAFQILPMTVMGRRVMLQPPETADVTPFQEQLARLEKLVGRLGKTIYPLNPGGMVLVENQRFECVSESGLMLPAGATIKITGLRGTRLVVRTATQDETERSGSAGRPTSDFDFDYPTS